MDPQAIRLLVFAFTVGITHDSRDNSSVNGMHRVATDAPDVMEALTTTGTNKYHGQESDHGEIRVEILGDAPGGGVSVRAREAANERNQVVTCSVYPNTNVDCGRVRANPEIVAVLRTLSPEFYDGAPMDDSHHWAVAKPNLRINFAAQPQSDGLIAITAERDQTFTGSLSATLHGNATYAYDPKAFVSKSVKEYTTIREETDAGSYNNMTIDITAALESDSKTH